MKMQPVNINQLNVLKTKFVEGLTLQLFANFLQVKA